MHHTRNTWCVVRAIRLEFSRTKRLLKSKLLIHSFINRICLIPVCYDRFITQYSDRCVNNQTWVCKLRWIKCLCTDSLSVLYKHTVSTVLTASHNKIGSDSLLSIRAFTNNNSSSWIRVTLKFLLNRQHLHCCSPFGTFAFLTIYQKKTKNFS